MSDADTAGFGKFVPGFDFLQNLAKGASAGAAQMPSLGAWVAPTMDEKELDKRISELKSVQFWLEQNSRALAATVQALEVQKMTLSTLKGMNFNLGDLASAFNPKTAAAGTAASPQQAAEPVKPAAKKTAAKKTTAKSTASAKGAGPAATGMVDPLQLWGSLTQQFQQIAATAMKEVGAQAAAASTAAKAPAAKTATKPAAKSAPRKRT